MTPDDQIEQGLKIQKDFEIWIENKKWIYIVPLKIFMHKNKEIYKTYEELKEMYLNEIFTKAS